MPEAPVIEPSPTVLPETNRVRQRTRPATVPAALPAEALPPFKYDAYRTLPRPVGGWRSVCGTSEDAIVSGAISPYTLTCVGAGGLAGPGDSRAGFYGTLEDGMIACYGMRADGGLDFMGKFRMTVLEAIRFIVDTRRSIVQRRATMPNPPKRF